MQRCGKSDKPFPDISQATAPETHGAGVWPFSELAGVYKKKHYYNRPKTLWKHEFPPTTWCYHFIGTFEFWTQIRGTVRGLSPLNKLTISLGTQINYLLDIPPKNEKNCKDYIFCTHTYVWSQKNLSLQKTNNACAFFHSKFNSFFWFSSPEHII